MGALKDIVDLCIKLRDEVGDRKAAEVVGTIQSLTLALQSEQATIVEKNSELVTENLSLKRKLLDMETSHAQAVATLQEKHNAEMAEITASQSKPKGELTQKTQDVLLYIFKKPGDFCDIEIASRFRMELGVAEYHTDILFRKGFIIQTRVGFERGGGGYNLTEAGRKYVVENGLAN
jgi:hypothetical protein